MTALCLNARAWEANEETLVERASKKLHNTSRILLIKYILMDLTGDLGWLAAAVEPGAASAEM